MTEVDTEPVPIQLRKGLEDLERRFQAAQSQHENPNVMERRCQEFENAWANKLGSQGEKHLAEGMKTAVDAIRSEQKPDLTFTMEEKPAFKITPEATRRMAQNRTRDAFKRDL